MAHPGGRGPAPAGLAMSGVELSHVGKSFGGADVIGDISLTVNSGEMVVFVGPSGCG